METFNRIEEHKDYSKEISTSFLGLTVDEAVTEASKYGTTLVDQYLNSQFSLSTAMTDLGTKGGLIKTGDEYMAPNQFALSGYELFDLAPNLPLSQFYHQGIMPVRVGGGYAETVSGLRLSWGLASGRLAGGNTNEVNVVNVMPSKFTVPAYTIKFGIVQGTVDLMKSAQVAYDVYGYKLEALRMSYQRELDYFAFLGNLGINGITESSANFEGGLLNAKGVVEEDASTDWSTWGIEDFITEFVKIFTNLLTLNRFDQTIVADTVVFPPELWERFAQPAVVGTVGTANGTGVVTSVIEYLKQQLKIRVKRDINFVELPYISKEATETYTTAGIVAKGKNGTGQIIFYRNSDKVLRMPIPMPLIGGPLQPSPTEDGLRQNFLSVVATPMFVYPTSVCRLSNA